MAKAAFDMGGTTAKLTLLDDLQLQRSRQFEVARAYRFVQGSGLLVRIPVIELVEIGAGGGSIARIDALGRIQVGPDSAGSVPGPASYGRGGTEPRSPTPIRRSAASIRKLRRWRHPLHRDKAEAALQSLAGPLKTDARARRPASPRSSTRPWRAPPACMPSRTARTRPSAR